jgi:hypothetical protein
MSRVSFFSLLSDSRTSLGEALAIGQAENRADAAVEIAQVQGDAIGNAIARLDQRVRAQDRDIKLLRTALGALAAMLRDSGALDAEMLDLRLEAAIANAEEEIDTAANTVTCPSCRRQVERRITVMTEAGIVCDRCHALAR